MSLLAVCGDVVCGGTEALSKGYSHVNLLPTLNPLPTVPRWRCTDGKKKKTLRESSNLYRDLGLSQMLLPTELLV